MKRYACMFLAAAVLALPAPAAETPPAAPSTGEIRKVDEAQQKLTIRHGPLLNLDMPAMTMVFRAARPSLLSGLKAGDKVKFVAEYVKGEVTVTWIERDR